MTIIPIWLWPPPDGHKDADACIVYPIPENLPPLPEPVLFKHKAPFWWAPAQQRSGPHIVKSGEMLQYPGVYMASYDEGLYYSPGTVAPLLYRGDAEHKKAVPCEWTLIWLDDRYTDGKPIPEEEKLYFPDDGTEKKKETIKFGRAFPGEPCPLSGMWYANFLPDSHKYFREGEIMPGPRDTAEGAVIWYWLQDEKYPESR